MNKILIKLGEFFGLFNKVREFLKGKKTMLTGVGMMLASGAAIVGLVISWLDGTIDASELYSQAQAPVTAFATGAGLVFASLHTKNVDEKKLGPGF